MHCWGNMNLHWMSCVGKVPRQVYEWKRFSRRGLSSIQAIGPSPDSQMTRRPENHRGHEGVCVCPGGTDPGSEPRRLCLRLYRFSQ